MQGYTGFRFQVSKAWDLGTRNYVVLGGSGGIGE